MFPARDRRSAAQTRLATVVVLALIVVGLWQLRQRDAPPPASQRSGPASADAPAATTPAPRAPTPPPADARDADRADRADRYDLDADEAKGGHTLARHVARTDAQLRERLEREPGISAASTYTTRALAERTVARTLTNNLTRVTAWLARRGSRPNLALDYRGPRTDVLGRSVRRGRSDPADCTNAIVVLRWDGQRGYYVLTSYPEAAR
jgi:hypothetical protein